MQEAEREEGKGMRVERERERYCFAIRDRAGAAQVGYERWREALTARPKDVASPAIV